MARIEKEVSWDSSFWDRLDSSLKFTSQELLLVWSSNNYFVIVIIHKSHIQGTKITFREGIGVDRLSASQTIWPRIAGKSNTWISSQNLEYFKKLVHWTLFFIHSMRKQFDKVKPWQIFKLFRHWLNNPASVKH